MQFISVSQFLPGDISFQYPPDENTYQQDDTKLLGGYPGKEVIIARRKGEVWYIGGVNGTNEASTLHVPLDKIPVSGKKISLFKDGVDDNHFTIEENIPLTDEKNDLVIECLPRGGFAAVIK